MNVVFFSLRTKTANNEQWWTAMLKKREKLKNLNFTAIRSSNSHQTPNCLEDERCFLLSSYKDCRQWAMMNCNVKKAWKVKKFKLYGNSVFKQPSKLQIVLNMNIVFFSLCTSTTEDEQWWTAMLKKAWKVKKFKLYDNSVFKQPSKLQIVLNMNIVFFSLCTSTTEDEQWWTAMLKKAWKVKKFKLYGNSVFKQPSNSKLSWRWTLFSSLFVRRRPKTSNGELQCFSFTWTQKIESKMRIKLAKSGIFLP